MLVKNLKTWLPSKSTDGFSLLEGLQIVVFSCLILYFGKTLFIPLSFAILISFILYPVCKWLESKSISKGIAVLISLSTVSILLGSLLFVLFVVVQEFSNDWPNVKLKLLETSDQVSIFLTERFDISSERQTELFRKVIDNTDAQILPVLRSSASYFLDSIYALLLVLIFSSLLLLHRRILSMALYSFLPKEQVKTSKSILLDTIHAYYNFVKGMMLVYLIVGVLNSIGLAIIGVPHPILFGFISSILTFIPYVGIIISSLLPITAAWLEYNSIWYPFGVILVFTVIQILEAYVIFPIAVGKRLSINTFIIFVTIVAGGILWGAVGMILFIPFVSILKLLADRTEKLKAISMLLSDSNDVKTNS